jgi:hypothetical protein
MRESGEREGEWLWLYAAVVPHASFLQKLEFSALTATSIGNARTGHLVVHATDLQAKLALRWGESSNQQVAAQHHVEQSLEESR